MAPAHRLIHMSDRRNKIMFDRHTRSTHHAQWESHDHYIVLWKTEKGVQSLALFPGHHDNDSNTTNPTTKQNKLIICDRGSQYNVQGKGKK